MIKLFEQCSNNFYSNNISTLALLLEMSFWGKYGRQKVLKKVVSTNKVDDRENGLATEISVEIMKMRKGISIIGSDVV